MPGIAAHPIARITQWFVLQPLRVKADRAAVRDQAFTIAGYEMRHWMSHPDMPVQPHSTRHRMYHSSSAVFELTPANRSHRRANY